MPIIFACISPHPPIILPDVGSLEDKIQVKDTIENLEKLGEKLKKLNPDLIVISSPHPDWGFEVPLFFLAKDFEGEIKTFLTGPEKPEIYLDEGKKFYRPIVRKLKNRKIALIASGDMSHCLKADGPYGFNPQGPEFDKDFMEAIKKKDIKTILKLDDKYPEAGECGLLSFCFILGILEEAETE